MGDGSGADELFQKMIEEAFADAGLDSLDSMCDYSTNPEHTDERRRIRTTLTQILAGMGVKKMFELCAMVGSTAAMREKMRNGGLTEDDQDEILHKYGHVGGDMYSAFVDYALAPFVRRERAKGHFVADSEEGDLKPPSPAEDAAIVESLCRIDHETFCMEALRRGWGAQHGDRPWKDLPEPMKEAKRAAMRKVLIEMDEM